MNGDLDGNLVCVDRITAVTYSFRTEGRSGWALCTVNEATCELSISSDYGRWSHRWHKSGFEGTFTSFLVNVTDHDYLARKLCAGDGRQFSARATVRMLRRRLCERRLEDGREAIENALDPEDRDDIRTSGRWWGQQKYDQTGLPVYASRRTARAQREGSPRDEHPELLTKNEARFLWDRLIRFDGYSSEDYFLSEYRSWVELGDLDDYLPDPDYGIFECMTSEPSTEWKYLHDRLLPALIRTLREELAKGQG